MKGVKIGAREGEKWLGRGSGRRGWCWPLDMEPRATKGSNVQRHSAG